MITGIVMAAGFSRRFGSNKLLSLYKTQPLFTFSLCAAKNSRLDSLLLVTQYSEIMDFCKKNGISFLQNAKAAQGQSQSVLLGVAHSSPLSHLMFLPADQPLITPEIINELLRVSQENPKQIIIPVIKGNASTPTIFPPSFREELLLVSGDQGGRAVIRNNPNRVLHVPINEEDLLFDVDTPADFDLLP